MKLVNNYIITEDNNVQKVVPFGVAVGNLRYANNLLERSFKDNDPTKISKALAFVQEMKAQVMFSSTSKNSSDIARKLWTQIFINTIQVVDTNLQIAHDLLSSSLKLI